jgi:hypothetical protein
LQKGKGKQMTKREALRQNQQENTLLELGFTRSEAESLRRISMTLHRWHELECGTDSYCISRGTWNRETQEFDHDDNGKPHYEWAGGKGKHRYTPIADRETGARKRLDAIVEARNKRAVAPGTAHTALGYYIQGDPRGAALYIIRPGDVPEGKSVESYYNRGICVY